MGCLIMSKNPTNSFMSMVTLQWYTCIMCVCMCVCVCSMHLYPQILLEIYFHVFSWSSFEPNSNLVKDVPSNNISILYMRSRFKVVTVINSKVEEGRTQVLFFPIYTKRTRLGKSESSNKLIFPWVEFVSGKMVPEVPHCFPKVTGVCGPFQIHSLFHMCQTLMLKQKYSFMEMKILSRVSIPSHFHSQTKKRGKKVASLKFFFFYFWL